MPEEFHTPETYPAMSFSDKFVGILSSPGEVFDNVAKNPNKQSTNWVIPMILTMVVTIIFTIVVFSQPPIQDQMRDTQMKAMQERVASGKMTQEQMNQAMEMNPAKPGSPMFIIFGSIAGVFVIVVMVLLYSTAYWLGGKVFVKSTVPFSKVTEVYGLSLYIGLVGALVTMAMVVAMGSLYSSPSLAIAVSNFDPANKVHKLLAAVNVFDFWQLGVIGIGLSKLWSSSLGKSLGVVVIVWVIWTAAKVFVGAGLGM